MYGFRDIYRREFPGSPEVRTPHLHCRGHASIPWGIKILQAATRSQNETKKKHPVVDVTSDGSKVRYCKEQYCI